MQLLFNSNCLEFMQSKIFKNFIKNKNICIITDPPFNVGYHYKTYKDNLKEEEYYNFLHNILSMYNIPYIIIHYPEALYKLALKMNNTPEKVISWVYNSNTAKQHRDIAFFNIKPDMNRVKQPYKNLNDKRIKDRIARGIGGGRLYDWWNINQVKNVSKKEINHPCVMPLEVMERIVGILPDDYIIFDPFMGTCTTGLACIKYKRNFIGCELDNDYFNISIKRLGDKIMEDYEQYEEELEENEIEVKESKEDKPKEKTPKEIVIETVKEIIEDYVNMCKSSNDEFFLEGYTKKNIDECVNYVMNNLTQQRIFGGRDSLMYPYIHEYYVDDIRPELLKDNWSSYMRSMPTPKAELTEEQKQKALEKAEEEFIQEQKKKLADAEKKKIEKEKARLEKEKEKAQKEKEVAIKNGAGEQMSLFDI